jgi:putative aldouronate transport system permease protein
MVKESKGSKVFSICNILFFLGVSVVMLVPFLNVVCISLEPEYLALDPDRLHLIPKVWSLDAYRMVLQNSMILRSLGNSLFITIVGSLLGVLLTAMFGYGLSFEQIFGHKVISFFLLFTMMFSGGIIPSYLLISKLGLIDSLWSLILPGMMTAYNVILMKTFFQSLPISLTESATLDGATEVQVFFRIILPLSKAILATIVLFYAVMFWNDFFNGIMYINDRTKKPLQVVLREILLLATADSGSSNVDSSLDLGMNVQMAVAIVSMIPIICVYPFLQKYFTKGVLIGAVKG